MTEETPAFETSLQALERVVRELESGGLSLDDALASYERGIGLLAQCRAQLDLAEKQVALLTGADEDGSPRTAPFDGGAADGAARKPGRKAPPPAAGALDDLPF